MSQPKPIEYVRAGWRQLCQAYSDELHAMPLYRFLVFSGPAPLLHKPWPVRPCTPNPLIGEEILKQQFQFAGKSLNFSNIEQAWSQPTPSRAFAKHMHSFVWLHDLAAHEDNEEIARISKAHVDTWIRQYGAWNRFSWNKEITAERCLAWLGSARLLFSGDAVATSARLDSLGRQLRHLKSVIKACEPGQTRLWIAIALATAGTCLHGMGGLQKTGLSLLETELEKQVMGDGGHISRNPAIAARLLLELDVLVALLEQHQVLLSSEIRKAQDRLRPFVQFTMMPNGELAPFNGSDIGDRLALKQTLEARPKKEKPFLIAPHSRYHRLQTRRSCLLVDCGGAPPLAYSALAHAGSLSFVFGTRAGTLITNCGWSDALGQKWRGPSRTTAAHSTLVIDDVSSARVLTNGLRKNILGPVLFDREQPSNPRRTEDEGGVCLTATNREYVSRYGLQHNRRLYLDNTGSDLRGEDVLERPIDLPKAADLQPVPFSIRFHLHPDVRASLSRSKTNVLLLLPNGEGWRFRCDSASLKLDPSVYLAAGAPPKRTLQIIIEGAADPNGIGQEVSNKVRWSLRRIEPAS
jgi:uncharacterized heparinase superfamily protein